MNTKIRLLVSFVLYVIIILFFPQNVRAENILGWYEDLGYNIVSEFEIQPNGFGELVAGFGETGRVDQCKGQNGTTEDVVAFYESGYGTSQCYCVCNNDTGECALVCHIEALFF